MRGNLFRRAEGHEAMSSMSGSGTAAPHSNRRASATSDCTLLDQYEPRIFLDRDTDRDRVDAQPHGLFTTG